MATPPPQQRADQSGVPRSSVRIPRQWPVSTSPPLYYVNDVPHIGHAYTTTAADVAARFHRQLGDDVFFLTGTDEHGTKVEQAAAARGLTPKEHADEMVVKFKDVARRVGAGNDFFIRTTDPQHEKYVQDFVQRCYDAATSIRARIQASIAPRVRPTAPRRTW